MPDTTPATEKTVADELREAAARSREHLLPQVVAEVLPQTALVVLCSKVHEEWEVTCRDCFMFDVQDRVLARLVATLINAREPLAAWLDVEADTVKELGVDPALGHGRGTRAALATARVINGTSPHRGA